MKETCRIEIASSRHFNLRLTSADILLLKSNSFVNKFVHILFGKSRSRVISQVPVRPIKAMMDGRNPDPPECPIPLEGVASLRPSAPWATAARRRPPSPRQRRGPVKPKYRSSSCSESDSNSENETQKKRSRKRKNSSDEEYREEPKRLRTRGAPPVKVKEEKTSPKPRTSRRRVGPDRDETRQVEHEWTDDGGPNLNDRSHATERPGSSRSLDLDSNTWHEGVDTHRFDQETEPDFERSSASNIEMDWKESDLLAQNEGLHERVAKNLIKLFEEDNTIPFIARYRKEMTGNMEPEQLRHVKETYEGIKTVKHKAATMLKSIEKLDKLTPSVRRSILCARSLSELDLINTPFKTGSKKTLAERARQLGLEAPAQTILDGSDYVTLPRFVNKEIDGLADVAEVQLGIQHIIADIFSKDRGILDFVAELRKSTPIRLESSRARGTLSKELTKHTKGSSKEEQTSKLKKLTAEEKQRLQSKVDEESKYRTYFEFSNYLKYIKPHQVLAINRGESQKELSVKVVVPDIVLDRLVSYCQRQWLSTGVQYELRRVLITDSIKDAYKRLIHPLIARQTRSELNQNAERASIEVLAVNMKKLLLMPPFRGELVLGIDPGFRNGCKVALIDLNGDLLDYGFFNLNCGRRNWDLREDQGAHWLRKILQKHRCEVIALGNGSGCRETEEYLSELIQTNFFKPLDVSYAIVGEEGASIYSCSEEARKEFPDLDPNLISAVSIARRLQDPLAELVKVEPKHLGVGMYQHDLPQKKLANTLDEVVVECVSFVGVDLNTSPHCLLRRVAGLNSSRADKILEYRRKHGPFLTREDIKQVKGIGSKSFEQCAGFIRIIPETVATESGSRKCNPLDSTWIHPESYGFATRFLEYCQVKMKDIGSADSIKRIEKAIASAGGISPLAVKLGAEEALVKLVADGLKVPKDHDLRSDFEKPLFRKGLTSINEIQSGDILTGRITNVTHFGAFVDIGVGQNGLIHNSGMGGKLPQFGDRVQVKVKNVEFARQRIGLQLLAII